MPSSPRTPTSRQHSQHTDPSLVSVSPQSNGYTSRTNTFSPRKLAHSRRTSLYSTPSTSLPRPASSHGHRGSLGAMSDFSGSIDHANGLGNLADELAEAWDEDGDGVPENNGAEKHEIPYIKNAAALQDPSLFDPNDGSGRKPGPKLTQTSPVISKISPNLAYASTSQRYSRKKFQAHEEDDLYGSDTEDIASISSLLEARIAAIESLACWSSESQFSDVDPIVGRVANSLKDLGSLSILENGASRLITTCNSVTTNLTHQTRHLQNLSHTILSPLSNPPDVDTVDSLVPMLASLALSIPISSSEPLTAFFRLRSSTTNLASALSSLSDTLNMSRQTTALASRRLNAAKQMVGGLKHEAEVAEESIKWIECERWENRLAERECAKVCSEVVGGFEELCQGWREKLSGEGMGATGVEVGAG